MNTDQRIEAKFTELTELLMRLTYLRRLYKTIKRNGWEKHPNACIWLNVIEGMATRYKKRINELMHDLSWSL